MLFFIPLGKAATEATILIERDWSEILGSFLSMFGSNKPKSAEQLLTSFSAFHILARNGKHQPTKIEFLYYI